MPVWHGGFFKYAHIVIILLEIRRTMAQILATEESMSSMLSNHFTALQYEIMEKELPLENKCVSFHNIHYEVSRRIFWKKLPPKTILDNVRYLSYFFAAFNSFYDSSYSGIMKTGLNAILGATGSGKTT